LGELRVGDCAVNTKCYTVWYSSGMNFKFGIRKNEDMKLK
jgi:hypothetical protein